MIYLRVIDMIHIFGVLLLIISTVSSATQIPCTGSLHSVVPKQYINNISNHLLNQYDPTPVNKAFIRSRYQGIITQNALTWNLNQYTSTGIISSADQRGEINRYPYCGKQAKDSRVGLFINTFAIPYQNITGGGPHDIYGYQPSVPKTIFTTLKSSLVLQGYFKVPWFYSPTRFLIWATQSHS